MSRIGKQPVAVPAGVKVSLNGNTIQIEGKQGSLDFTFSPSVKVVWDESEKSIAVSINEAGLANRQVRALWGTTRAIINNMIVGVTEGYTKKLEIIGVGWTAVHSGQTLKLNVGFANAVEVAIPTGLNVAVEKQMITLTGADKQAIGQLAAKIRSKRPPEPYNGKGIKYADEVIVRKQGKQFGS